MQAGLDLGSVKELVVFAPHHIRQSCQISEDGSCTILPIQAEHSAFFGVVMRFEESGPEEAFHESRRPDAFPQAVDFSSRVGRQRGTLLPFSVGPSPNRCMHLLAHTALRLMTATQLQFVAHLVPFILSTVTHLSPFPLSRALPQAVEYYGDSVAMSLAAGRRSRIDPHETYSACRYPFRSL